MADEKKQQGKKKKAKQAAPDAKAGKKEKKAKKDGAKKGGGEKGGFPRITGLTEYERRYRESCIPALKEKFGYTNAMQVPKLTKIVVNTSMRDALTDIKVLQNAAEEIAAITGQRPVTRKAKKSIANFKLRQGQSIGASVTLRGKAMYEFLNRLVNIALPRVRDFKGVSPKAFDGRGNYTLGLTDQTIFPEINFDKVQRQNGMNVTFVTTAKTNEEGHELLRLMGMPFRNA